MTRTKNKIRVVTKIRRKIKRKIKKTMKKKIKNNQRNLKRRLSLTSITQIGKSRNSLSFHQETRCSTKYS